MREIIKYTPEMAAEVRQSLQECIAQFVGSRITPMTLTTLEAMIKQNVERVWDPVKHYGQHVNLKIECDPDDPSKVLISPKDMYTTVILTGQFDRSYDEILFLTKVVEDYEHHTTYEYENPAGRYLFTVYHLKIMDRLTGEAYILHEPESWFFPVEIK